MLFPHMILLVGPAVGLESVYGCSVDGPWMVHRWTADHHLSRQLVSIFLGGD